MFQFCMINTFKNICLINSQQHGKETQSGTNDRGFILPGLGTSFAAKVNSRAIIYALQPSFWLYLTPN